MIDFFFHNQSRRPLLGVRKNASLTRFTFQYRMLLLFDKDILMRVQVPRHFDWYCILSPLCPYSGYLIVFRYQLANMFPLKMTPFIMKASNPFAAILNHHTWFWLSPHTALTTNVPVVELNTFQTSKTLTVKWGHILAFGQWLKTAYCPKRE